MFRDELPQLGSALFLTDGGIETTLIFQDGQDLPLFAAFPLLRSEDGCRLLRRYFRGYAELAHKHDTGFILESPTWRASLDWGRKLGYSPDDLVRANHRAVELMEEVRREWAAERPFVISGCIGPQGDGYRPATRLTAPQAQAYHRLQVEAFRDSAADMVTAITMTYAEEAIGIAGAARDAGLPSAISFTVETDGRLPSGQTLGGAVEQVDRETGSAPAYYMINCAHPVHFDTLFETGSRWMERIRGLRANASTRSHAELDEATELDAGDPADLGERTRTLRGRLPHLNVLGGCCGTDTRHVDAMARAVKRVQGGTPCPDGSGLSSSP